ncbi:MAG: Acyl-homoserine lactone acylase QuiP [Myxococcota bacterium]|nr:Acyl-homoserine lactone acylase QuiP [Myxococcota bacterium]
MFAGLLRKLTPVSGALFHPKREGKARVRGLGSRVQIYFSPVGAPHVFAESARDLYLAQGYITAGDRLWQMEFMRRAISGRLAEILGDQELDWRELSIQFQGFPVSRLDAFIRTLGLARAAEESLSVLSPQSIEALEAYAEGVTRYIESRATPSAEFALLGFRPGPWTPADSLKVLKGFAFDLCFSWRTVLFNGMLEAKFPNSAERLAELFPRYPAGAPTTTRMFNPKGQAEEPRHALERALLSIEEGYRLFTGYSGAHVGSNAWVVGPSRTASGHAILCNDPHLAMQAPSVWYETRLHSPGVDVAGMGIPGLPGVVIGHNQRIAWGLTNLMAHDADIFMETLDPSDSGRVMRNGAAVPLSCREERIFIKGKKDPEIHTVRESDYGPIISGVLDDLAPAGQAYALKWTALQPSRELDGLLALNSAGDFEAVRRAAELFTAPALNLVYADTSGNIGYQVCGKIPVRKNGKNLTPVPAGNGEYDWRGTIPFHALPRLLNPKEGFAATANNKVVDELYPWFISELWEPPYRFERINELLSGVKLLTLNDMQAIQNDVFSGWARRVRDNVIRPWRQSAGAQSPEVETALRMLFSWDFVSRGGSAAAALFYVFYQELIELLFREQFGERIFQAFFEVLNESVVPVEELLSNPDSAWIPHGKRDRLIGQAMNHAVERLSRSQGPDVNAWRWDCLHTVTMKHRFHAVSVLRPYFSIGPFPASGDGMTVNNGGYRFSQPYEHRTGASMRIIMDCGNWDNTMIANSTGQSGHPSSPQYADQTAAWTAGKYHRSAFSRGEVERFPRLVLAPALKLQFG